ncbi:MAG TPA: hypothetical protein VFE06_06600 [Acidobacteriaceae bacterium]|jgi:hypothetical protein|nr:hypothetical protein [Acidobacteriaceae bacterium]
MVRSRSKSPLSDDREHAIDAREVCTGLPDRRPLHAAPARSGPQFVILAPVRVLYGVLLFSTVVIVWVAIAVARHIVQHRRAIRSHTEHHDDPV